MTSISNEVMFSFKDGFHLFVTILNYNDVYLLNQTDLKICMKPGRGKKSMYLILPYGGLGAAGRWRSADGCQCWISLDGSALWQICLLILISYTNLKNDLKVVAPQSPSLNWFLINSLVYCSVLSSFQQKNTDWLMPSCFRHARLNVSRLDA